MSRVSRKGAVSARATTRPAPLQSPSSDKLHGAQRDMVQLSPMFAEASAGHVSTIEVLRFFQTERRVLPVWTAPTVDLSTWSPLAADRNPWVPDDKQEPIGFLGKGDAMIRRPYLVARPVRSDWRTRRPRLALHLDDRRTT
jgi:hypothetical protein